MKKKQIFISYRSYDSAIVTRNIYDKLTEEFDENSIFYDNQSIEPSEKIRKKILEETLPECKFFLCVIGKDWLSIKDKKGQRLLDNTDDIVRREIEEALANNLKIIQLVIEPGDFPKKDDLPEAIQKLTDARGIRIRAKDFEKDISELINAVRKGLFPKALLKFSLKEKLGIYHPQEKFIVVEPLEITNPTEKQDTVKRIALLLSQETLEAMNEQNNYTHDGSDDWLFPPLEIENGGCLRGPIIFSSKVPIKSLPCKATLLIESVKSAPKKIPITIQKLP